MDTVEFFSMQLSLIGIVLVLHTYMGLHIIRRSIIFCDLALAQLAALGALLSVALGVGYGTPLSYLVSLGAVLSGAAILASVKPKSKLIPQEAVIGIVYALAFVVAFLVVDKLPSGTAYLHKTLSGSMLWVSWRLVGITVLAYSVLIGFHYLYRERFIALVENPGRASRLWDFLFFSTQGVITVLIVPVAGVLLAYSFLMIPAGMAVMFTDGWLRGVWLGWLFGMTSCAGGVWVSYHFNLPYGPALILAMGLFFIAAITMRYIQQRKGSL